MPVTEERADQGSSEARRGNLQPMVRSCFVLVLAGLSLLVQVNEAAARRRHRQVAHHPAVVPSGAAASAGALFGLVDTGIATAADGYPGFQGVPPGYGFYGHGYYGPGFGSPGY